MKLRSLVVATILFLVPVGGSIPAGSGSSACAASAQHAAIAVDTGDQELRFCVVLPPGTVTGIDLIELASDQHGLQYRLGYGGQGVCQLAGVGSEGEECFTDSPEFWGYWRGDGSGGWTWSSTGAGSVTVSPGDVQGWSYGTGRDPSTHQTPPPTTYGLVCPAKGTGGDGGDDEGGPAQEDEPEQALPSPSETTAPEGGRGEKDELTGTKEKPDPKKHKLGREPSSGAVPLTSGQVSDSSSTAVGEESGIPLVGIGALILAFGLSAGGAAAGRRRKLRESS